MIEPTIVVIAYNRKKPLLRLLKSLANAHYPSSTITLHISIDGSSMSNEIEKAANAFEWKYGNKIVDVKQENQGLLKHVLSCGELTERYESIIMLEDDLIVAPGFYNYAQSANDFYSDEQEVAGVSLFTYPVEENNFYPFQPIHDDSDVHFIQVASSWGQSWTKAQWSKFKTWLIENPQGKENLLPDYILKWGSNSWKKLFVNYLIDTDRYFVFPTTSYSSNFEEEGTHASQTGLFQVPMKLGISNPRLKKWHNSNAIYDVYFELIPSACKRILPQFETVDFDVDLFGTKPVSRIKSDYMLTIRRGENPEKRYGANMQSLIHNVIFEIEGSDIFLIHKSNLLEQDEPDRFLKLSNSKEKLRQNKRVFSLIQQQVTIVIPAIDEKKLQQTFDQLYKDRFYNVTILISCPFKVSEKFKHLEDTACCSVNWVHSESSDLNQLLFEGFNACKTDYVGWAQAGMSIDLKKFEKVSTIFSGMKQVNFLRGIDEEVNEENYFTKNSARSRTTPYLAYYHARGYRETSTELMVWRRAMLDEIKQNLNENYSNLFIELLKATPLYVLVDKIGSLNGIEPLHSMSKQEVRKSLSNSNFRRNGFIRLINHPYFHPGFYCNFPFIRFFYKELGQFPMVIRYDFKNDSYFLDNY